MCRPACWEPAWEPLSIGRALFEASEGTGLHRAVAGIAQPNEASVALHLGSGFRLVGRFTEPGRKFGRYWDVDWYERRIIGL